MGRQMKRILLTATLTLAACGPHVIPPKGQGYVEVDRADRVVDHGLPPDHGGDGGSNDEGSSDDNGSLTSNGDNSDE
jgi:hypothetical protein